MKKLFLLLVAVCITANIFTQENYNSGNNGNITWILTTDGVLTISGTGGIMSQNFSPPWIRVSYGVDMQRIKKVIIKNGVKNIGRYAFSRCAALTSVSIPESVTSIDESAFSNCTALTSVSIPGSVTSIGESAFSYCKALASVSIAEGVTSIGRSAFFDSGLTSITLPNSVTSVGVEAFSKTPWYNNQPNGPVYINKVFYKYKGNLPVEYLTVADGTICIADNAFDAISTTLEIITLPNSLTTIGNEVFKDFLKLVTVTNLNSVKYVGEKAFDGTPWYRSQPNGLRYIGKALYSYKGTMPANTSIVVADGTVSISMAAFQYESGLTSITIPNSVKSVGYKAFSSCSGLTSITIPESVTSIGEYAFSYCSGLTSITIPNSVTSLGDAAFFKCSALTSVTLPTRLTTIPDGVFSNCSGLTSITIPNSVTYIENHAFINCESLVSIDIPNSVKLIGMSSFKNSGLKSLNLSNFNGLDIEGDAFANCPELTSLTIENSEIYIGAAFRNSIGLTSVRVLNSITSIGEQAFSSCLGLTSVNISGGETTIEQDAFLSCTGLTSITIPKGLKRMKPAFRACTNLTSVVWNAKYCADFDSIHTPFYFYYRYEDGQYSSENFDNRSQITSFTFGDSVEYIPAFLCFGMTEFDSVVIPNSVERIGDKAFYLDSALVTVHNCSKLIFAKGSKDYGYVANYALNLYNNYCGIYRWLDVLASDPLQGSVSGSGYYDLNELAKIEALSNSGYHFVEWNDGNTENPRMVDVTKDSTFVATFAINMYSISASANDATMGQVTGSGSYSHNTQATIEAIPNDGYAFVQWNDLNTQNPRQVLVTNDATYTATFMTITAIEQVTAESLNLRIENGTILCDGTMRIYDVIGRDVTHQNGSLHGIYMVRVDDAVVKVIVK